MRIRCALIFIFICFVINFSYSQSYFDDNPLWRMTSICPMTDVNCFSHNDYNYYINGDTVINTHVYKKLFKYGYGYYEWLGPNPIPPNCQGSFIIGSEIIPYGFIRDTLREIYMLDNPEQCIYDFNLNVGDTLPICYGNSDQTILSIDSLLVNGNYMKRYHLSHSGGQSQAIIEGIGHEYGFIEGLPPILNGCMYNLVCFSVNNISYYPNSNLDCHSVNSINELFKNSVNIFHNSSLNCLYLRANGLKIEGINLFDLFGRSIKIVQINDVESSLKIDLPQLSTGYYFLSINTNEGVFSKPIIISNKSN